MWLLGVRTTSWPFILSPFSLWDGVLEFHSLQLIQCPWELAIFSVCSTEGLKAEIPAGLLLLQKHLSFTNWCSLLIAAGASQTVCSSCSKIPNELSTHVQRDFKGSLLTMASDEAQTREITGRECSSTAHTFTPLAWWEPKERFWDGHAVMGSFLRVLGAGGAQAASQLANSQNSQWGVPG